LDILEISAPAEWDRFASQFDDYTYEQSFAFSQHAANRVGARLVCLGVLSDGKPVGAAAIREKRIPGLGFGIAHLPSGPLLSESGVAPEVLKALRDRVVVQNRNVLRLRVSILQPDDLLSDAQVRDLGFSRGTNIHDYQTCIVDLDHPIDVVRKKLHSKWRNQLNKSAQFTFEIEAGKSERLIARFLDLYKEMRSFKTFETELDPQVLFDLLDSDFRFEVLIAHHDGVDLGAYVTCYTDSVATYVLGANGHAGRDMRTGYALMWQSLENARARNIPVFDLGGVDQDKNPEGYRFKTRTGGVVRSAFSPLEARPSGLAGKITIGLEKAYRLARGK